MSKVITAVFDSDERVTNVLDDLIGTGFPQEKIRSDKTKRQVQVMSPDTAEPEVLEILRRHQPTSLDT